MKETIYIPKKETIYIPKDARILVVEDNAQRILWFRGHLSFSRTEYAMTCAEALNCLQDGAPYDIIFLDHDAGLPFDENDTFYDVAVRLNELDYRKVVIIHSMNPAGARRMRTCMKNAYGFCFPFGTFEIAAKP